MPSLTWAPPPRWSIRAATPATRLGGYSIMQAESPEALAGLLENHRTRRWADETLELLSMPGI